MQVFPSPLPLCPTDSAPSPATGQSLSSQSRRRNLPSPRSVQRAEKATPSNETLTRWLSQGFPLVPSFVPSSLWFTTLATVTKTASVREMASRHAQSLRAEAREARYSPLGQRSGAARQKLGPIPSSLGPLATPAPATALRSGQHPLSRIKGSTRASGLALPKLDEHGTGHQLGHQLGRQLGHQHSTKHGRAERAQQGEESPSGLAAVSDSGLAPRFNGLSTSSPSAMRSRGRRDGGEDGAKPQQGRPWSSPYARRSRHSPREAGLRGEAVHKAGPPHGSPAPPRPTEELRRRAIGRFGAGAPLPGFLAPVCASSAARRNPFGRLPPLSMGGDAIGGATEPGVGLRFIESPFMEPKLSDTQLFSSTDGSFTFTTPAKAKPPPNLKMPLLPEACDEIGRVTRAGAAALARERHARSQMLGDEPRAAAELTSAGGFSSPAE